MTVRKPYRGATTFRRADLIITKARQSRGQVGKNKGRKYEKKKFYVHKEGGTK